MATKISNQFTKTITLEDGSIFSLVKGVERNVAVFQIESKQGVKGDMKVNSEDVRKIFVLMNAGYIDMSNEQE